MSARVAMGSPSGGLGARLGERMLAGRRRATLLARTTTRRLLAVRYLRGEGLEIGALHLPLDLPPWAKARYVDLVSTQELKQELPGLAEAMVDVEVVDDGETLLTVEDQSQDFLVANHMIEHCQDPIGTLSHHLRVLRPGGRIFMAVPEKRRTFDRERAVTSFDHLLSDHIEGPERSRSSHYEEWARFVDGASARTLADRARYIEEHGRCIHFHVWTRPAFQKTLARCRRELGLPFEVEVVWPNLSEFVAVLTRTDAPVPSYEVTSTITEPQGTTSRRSHHGLDSGGRVSPR